MSDSVYFSERTKTYDIPISHLDFKYLDSCNDPYELEKILKTLRSGEVGRYAELESFCEEKVKTLHPNSRVLRKAIEPIKITQLDKEERQQIEEDFQSWLNEVKTFNEEIDDDDQNSEIDYYLLKRSKKKSLPGKQFEMNDEELEEKCLKYDNEDLPPIRKSIIFSDNKQLATQLNSKGDYTFGKRVLKPKDYSEWDKLAKQWDKELTEDNQPNNKFEKELKLRLVNMPIQTRKKLAEREKEKGNESFKSGDYADAMNYYKRSLIMHKTNAVYNNRALIYLRQKQWKQAVNDCTKVLKTEPDNLKALFRRSQANFELDNLEQAENDLNRLTDQDPTNFKAQNLLRNVKIAISKRQEPHLKGSRRMIITDVGDSSSDDDDDESDENVEENEYQQQEQQQQHIQGQEIVTMNKNDNIQLTDKSTIDINKQESSLNVRYDSKVDTNNNEDIITTFDNGDIYCQSEVNDHLEHDEVSINSKSTYSIVDYEELKQKGNESFKKGNMKLALIYFNKCIELCLKYNLTNDKRLAVIYRNRSLIYLQLNEYQLACNDCTSALSIESNCPIALYRRALALKFLGDHSGCLKDLQKAYNLSPNNNRIIEELKKMQNTLVQTDNMNTDILINKSQTVITTSTISTTSDLEIIELPNVDSEKEDHIHDDNINDDDDDDNDNNNDNNNTEILEVEAEEENDESYDKLLSIQCNNMNPSCHISTNLNDFSKFQSNNANIMTKSIDNEWEEVNLINKEGTKIVNTSSINSTTDNRWKLDKPITNSHEFQNCWINIQHLKRSNYTNAINQIITLLNNILPEQLPKLIGIRMEAEMLDDLLNAINVSMNTKNINSLWIYDILIQLSKTARFDCALFLISDGTKEAIKCIIDRLHHRYQQQSSELKQCHIEQLQSIYSI
ncbi:unnamed protein product [Schistosoma mattheei]|uniref:RNA-polymerase II-associated protein 3-like C-terminal domain-containing protein n=2 Tax=Schistosoma mattheei TaxID=31246 RepID=A0AA85AQ11_9TREM|nr:unnamed protein product [Schistosoma mattheei]